MTGSCLADLVFGPTLACRGVRRPKGGLAPSPGRETRPGQGLHLSRTMLSDQWSPYVGRFACDWHRLPRDDPSVNHRPRLKPGGIIATGGNGPSERPSRGEHADLACAGPAEHSGAFGSRRSAGQHVIDQDHQRRRPRHGLKRPAEGPSPFRSRAPGLRTGLCDATKHGPNRPAREGADLPGQHFRLIESALALAT